MNKENYVKYIDICINFREDVKLKYIDETDQGFEIKLLVNNLDMGNVILSQEELVYYSLLLQGFNLK